MKTRRSVYNSITGMAYYFITVLMGFVNRKAVISILGIEYQGINGLFGNVLSMLSIAELGIGAAIVYNLYAPLENDDRESVKSLMAFYKKCYWIIGIAIAVIGVALIPVIPNIIKDYTLPYPLAKIYLWFLFDSALSYFFSYRRSLLIADQQNYVVNLFDAGYAFLVRVGQILVLYLTGNFILYLVCLLVFRLAGNLLIYLYAGKVYPYLSEKQVSPLTVSVFEDIKTKVKGALFHKVGGFVVLGTDNILISKFIGLAAAGIYSNYYLIINTLNLIVNMCISAATASIGHMLLSEDRKGSFEVFKEIRLLNFTVTCIFAAGIYCVATPLIAFVFGEEYILDKLTLTVLTINFGFQSMRTVFSVFKEAAGILYEDRFVPIIESVVNIVTSIMLLKRFGLAGVFMGTIISSLVLYIYTYPKFIYKSVLQQPLKEYIFEFLWQSAVFFCCVYGCSALCGFVFEQNLLLGCLLRFVITIGGSTITVAVGYLIWKKETWCLFLRLKGAMNGRK